MGVNKQIIIGNLGKDPDVRTFPDGTKACRFTVAVTDKGYVSLNGTQVPDHTEWFNILCRGKRAEVCEQYLHKGDKVYIEGATFTGEYQDQNGQMRRYTEVRCDVIELLTPKAQPQQQAAPQQWGVQQPAHSTSAAQPAGHQSFQPAGQQSFQPAGANPAPVGVYGQPAQPVPLDKPWP